MRLPYRTSLLVQLSGRWKHRLCLHEWTVHWRWMVDGSNGYDGETSRESYNRTATIRLNAGTLNECTYQRFREVVVHELLHLRISVLADAVEHAGIRPLIGESAWTVYWAQWQRSMEKEVDQLAEILVEVAEWKREDEALLAKDEREARRKGRKR